jgi:hypothetical protein
MNFIQRLRGKSVMALTRTACWLALAGLAAMSYSIVSPRPLPVVFAMSVGQGIGILAFFCYLLAVVIDVGRQPPTSLRPQPVPLAETTEPAEDDKLPTAPTASNPVDD